MFDLSKRCAVVGIGEARIGRREDLTDIQLAVEAVDNAVLDAGLSYGAIDGILSYAPYADPEFLYAIKLAETLGIQPSFGFDLHIGGATPCAAAAVAAAAIDAGLCNVVLYVGAEAMWSQYKEGRATDGKLRWGMKTSKSPSGSSKRRRLTRSSHADICTSSVLPTSSWELSRSRPAVTQR